MSNLITGLLCAVIGSALVYSCNFSDWAKRLDADTKAQERADRTPHVIREADGCKVYAFKTGDWHYFTRCPNSTVQTDRSYTENCGKNCTRHKVESITTESK